MPLTLSDVLSSATAAEWEAKILSIATSLGLKATSWQPGGVARTIIAIVAQALAASDVVSTEIAAGGYLDTAAAVTAEGGPGWLDLVALYVFDVTRTQATQGNTTATVTNAGAAVGPLPAGTYHVQAASGNTYRNSLPITLAPGTTTIDLACDQFGEKDDIGTVLMPITAYSGVTIGNTLSAATGTPVETNAALILRCRSKLSALAPKLGNASSCYYFATTTSEPGYPIPTAPITRVKVYSSISGAAVTVYLANANGAPTAPQLASMGTYLDGLAVPDGVSASYELPNEYVVNLAMNVWCPSAYSGQVSADVSAAFGSYINSIDIGGELTETGNYGVSFNGLENYISRKVTYLRTQTSTLNGSAASIQFLLIGTVAKKGTVAVTRIGA